MKMIKLVDFKSGNLDCYGKSIRDFILKLRSDILKQIMYCKNDKNYGKYIDFFNDLEEKIKSDGFIKKYFNHNRDEEILKEREKKIEEIVKLESFSWNFFDSIFKDKFINFYLEDFLKDEDFDFTDKEKNGDIDISKTFFDDILIYKKSNIKIYLEYKIREDNSYICMHIPRKNVKLDNNKLFKKLQDYANFVVQNIDNKDLIGFNQKDYFYIKIVRDKNRKKGKNNHIEEEKELSNNIIKYLNKELIKEIVSSKEYVHYLESFIPNNI